MNDTHLSLFSGIGGLDIAAEWAGFKTIAFVERDRYCQRVLAKHWPGVPIYDDVCAVTADAMRERYGPHGIQRAEQDSAGPSSGPIDGCGIGILSGGFPCQPHSVAGKRKASTDERDLWGECARIVGEFRPRWCVFENVPGLLTSERGTFFARILDDLAALGYVVTWFTYGAVDVGAPHRRDRVFIVANASGRRFGGQDSRETQQPRRAETVGSGEDVAHANAARKPQPQGSECHERGWVGDGGEDVADADGARPQGRDERIGSSAEWLAWSGREPNPGIWRVEPAIRRVAHGVPKRVDRLRALGNAVVPQQAYPIFKAIAEIEGIEQ